MPTVSPASAAHSRGIRQTLTLLFRSLLYPPQSVSLDVEGIFTRLTSNALTDIGPPPAGSCFVTSVKPGMPSYSSLTNPLDPGRIEISGPMSGILTKIEPGHYYDGGSVNSSGFPPGTYIIEGGGGADVKPFRAQITIATPFEWTNHADFDRPVARAQGLKLTWTATAADGLMIISGGSAISSPSPGVISEFHCTAPVGPGVFTVPPLVTTSLPASKDAGYLSLMRVVVTPFTAAGLDTAVIRYQERALTESVRFQ